MIVSRQLYFTIKLEEIFYFCNKKMPYLCGLRRFANAYITEICARSFEEAAQYTIDLFGLQETVEGIIEEWNNMAVEEYSNHVGLLPHALDYLLRLKEHGIKLAVATGLPEKLYMPCLKNNSILELFDALCSTDVGRILRTFKIKKNVEVTDNGKIII